MVVVVVAAAHDTAGIAAAEWAVVGTQWQLIEYGRVFAAWKNPADVDAVLQRCRLPSNSPRKHPNDYDDGDDDDDDGDCRGWRKRRSSFSRWDCILRRKSLAERNWTIDDCWKFART